MRTQPSALLCALIFLLLGSAFGQAPSQPQPSQDTQLLRALLEEVRQLRTAVQKTSLQQHRSQILLEQISRQKTLVENLQQELEQLRVQIRATADLNRFDEDLKEFETAYNETADPTARAQMQQAYGALKRSVERQKKQAQEELHRNQEQELRLNQQLVLEQAKLAELEQQVNVLMNDLVQVAEAGKR